MTTAAKEAKVGSFDVTILKASGIKHIGFITPKFYVTVEIGDQVCQTNISAKRNQPVWDETFTFPANGIQNVKISLYQTNFISKHLLLGSTTKSLIDFEPRGREVEWTIPMKTGGKSATLTVRAGETIFSGYKCRVYALIIGIDQYASPTIPCLRGSVNDAKAFKGFLTDRLHVPGVQIKLLLNKDATRSAILNTFQKHLTENPQIDEGDALIFFYAGHGSRIPAPGDWSTPDGMIETVCPYDERTKDEKGEDIHGIPDRSINAMFRELAAKKGDNITAIFDSCHSGGITRETSNKTVLTARFVDPLPNIKIPPSLDSDIWSTTHARAANVAIPAGFKHRYMASHVLLAACRQGQLACEATTADGVPCGFFTDNLIKHLRLIDLDRVTYADLLSRLPERINQNPQCEGENKTRILFNGKVVVRDPNAFKLTKKDGAIAISAGTLQGVIVGTEFAVQDVDATPSSRNDLGILVAISVDINSSVLDHRPGADALDVPQEATVVVSDWKNDALTLKIAIEMEAEDELARALFPPPDPTQRGQVERILKNKFVKVHARTDADIAVKRDSAEDDNLIIDRLDALIPTYTNTTTQFNTTGKLDNFPSIFDAIAQFNYHLASHNSSHPLDQLISLELYKLNAARVPDKTIGNLFVDNDVRLLEGAGAHYGLAIINRSTYDLFPYLFYFDPSDYSIMEFFVPPAATGSAPLHSQRGPDPTEITVGYGAGGGDPLTFTLNDGEMSDTGFFKLFVFSKYVDMGWLAQGSAFNANYKRKVRRVSAGEGIWDAWVAAVTVYRELHS